MDHDYKQENIEIYKRKRSDRPDWGKQWHKETMKYLMDKGPVKSRNRILEGINEEFGLIIGLASELYSVTSFSSKLIGVNIAVEELKKAKKSYQDIELVTCDAENLPFRNCFFGCIFSNATLHHMEPNSALPELNRVIKHGGHLVLLEPGLFNPIAMIERKFFPTNIHVKSEKPFDPTLIRKMLLKYFGTISSENYFFLFIPLLPVLAKYFAPFRNKKFLNSCYSLENSFVKKILKKFCWIMVMDIIKSK